MKRVDMDPKTRPAETVALGTALLMAVYAFIDGDVAEGLRNLAVGIVPMVTTYLLEKFGKYQPPTEGELRP